MAEVLAGRGHTGARPLTASRRGVAADAVTTAELSGATGSCVPVRRGNTSSNVRGGLAEAGAGQAEGAATTASAAAGQTFAADGPPQGWRQHPSGALHGAQQALPHLPPSQALDGLPRSSSGAGPDSNAFNSRPAGPFADGGGNVAMTSNIRPRAAGDNSRVRKGGMSLLSRDQPRNHSEGASGIRSAALQRLPAPPTAAVSQSRARAAGASGSGAAAAGAGGLGEAAANSRSGSRRPVGGAAAAPGLRPKLRRPGPVAGPGSAAESRAAAAAAAAANAGSDRDGEGSDAAPDPERRLSGAEQPYAALQAPLSYQRHSAEDQALLSFRPQLPQTAAYATGPAALLSSPSRAPLVPSLAPTSSRPSSLLPLGGNPQTASDGRHAQPTQMGSEGAVHAPDHLPAQQPQGRHEPVSQRFSAHHAASPRHHEGEEDTNRAHQPVPSTPPQLAAAFGALSMFGPLGAALPSAPGTPATPPRPPSASPGAPGASLAAPFRRALTPPTQAVSASSFSPSASRPSNESNGHDEPPARGAASNRDTVAAASAAAAAAPLPLPRLPSFAAHGEAAGSSHARGAVRSGAASSAAHDYARSDSTPASASASAPQSVAGRAGQGAPTSSPHAAAPAASGPLRGRVAPWNAATNTGRDAVAAAAGGGAAAGSTCLSAATSSGRLGAAAGAAAAAATSGRQGNATGYTASAAAAGRQGVRQGARSASSGEGGRGEGGGDGPGDGSGAAAARLAVHTLGPRGLREALPHDRAGSNSTAAGNRAAAGAGPRRHSHGAVGSQQHSSSGDVTYAGGGAGPASGIRGAAVRQLNAQLQGPSPYLAPAAAAAAGGGSGGRNGAANTAGGGGGNVSRPAGGALAVTRILFESVPYVGDDFEDDGGGGEYGSYGAVRPPPQRLFRLQPNQQGAERTSFGAARGLGLGPARAPHPPPGAHSYAHAHAQAAQGPLRRRRPSTDDGVVGGALALGGGGGAGGGGGGGSFQERFLGELRRRDAERAALMQLLAAGNEEELLRQAEEEQLAMALMLSLQDANGGAAAPGGGGAAVAVELPGGRGPAAALQALAALTRGSLLVSLGGGGVGGGLVALGGGLGGAVVLAAGGAEGAAGAAPYASEGASYEELLQLEDVKVPTPQEVLDALPYSTYDGCSASEGACAICQSDYEAGEVLLRLPCAHVLHAECGRRWLGDYSKKCPICKHPVC